MGRTFRDIVQGVNRVPDDCAIIAVAALTDVTYHIARHALLMAGTYPSDGATDPEIFWALRACDVRCDWSEVEPSGRTIRTQLRRYSLGYDCLLFTADHVLAVIGGEAIDDPKYGDLLRIEKVFLVY